VELQTPTDDDDDRRQRAKQYWPIRRASNKYEQFVYVCPLQTLLKLLRIMQIQQFDITTYT